MAKVLATENIEERWDSDEIEQLVLDLLETTV
jgi:hypothetical protein